MVDEHLVEKVTEAVWPLFADAGLTDMDALDSAWDAARAALAVVDEHRGWEYACRAADGYVWRCSCTADRRTAEVQKSSDETLVRRRPASAWEPVPEEENK